MSGFRPDWNSERLKDVAAINAASLSITAEQMILGATPMSGNPEVPHDID